MALFRDYMHPSLPPMPGGAPWKWDLSLVHLCNLALELWAWSMWYITMGYGMTGVGGKGEENELKGED